MADFNWDDHPIIKDDTQNEPISKTESFARGAFTGGVPFGDRAVAGAKTGIAELQDILGVDTGANVKPTYEENLELVRNRNKAAEEENPMTSLAGNIAGAAGQVMLLPEVAAERLGLSALAEGATMGQKAAQALKGGAALGAIGGLSNTKDLTDIKDAATNTGLGAGVGAITGATASTVLHAGGKLLDRAAKTKLAQKFIQAARVGQSGADVAGTEAAADLSRNSENHILNEFMPRIRNIEEDLVGKIHPETGQYVPGQYDKLYQAANEKLPQGVDVGGLADRLKSFQDMIYNSDTLQTRYSVDDMLKLDNIISALKQRAGKSTPVLGEGPEGLISGQATKPTPMSVSELRSEVKNLQDGYDKSPENNGMLLAMKKIYDAHLDNTLDNLGLSDAKQVLDAKFKQLSGVKDMLGIEKGMTGIEPQKVARKIATKFENAADSDPHAMNDVAKAGADLIRLDPEAAPVLSDMVKNAENSVVSGAVNKGASTSPRSQSFIQSAASNLGLGAGKGMAAVQDVIKGATNLVHSDPEQVQQLAGHMLGSENPTTKRMGDLLNKVTKEPDAGRRRAMMFSLSQQPVFRENITDALKNLTGFNFNKNEDERLP